MSFTLEMLKDAMEGIDTNWRKILIGDNINLIQSIIKELPCNNLCPRPCDIFNAMRLTRLDDVRCIIIGQDPYHSLELIDNDMQPIAHGLAFSSKGSKIPPSLANIYGALVNSRLLRNTPKVSNLTHWATQGMLLLNTALTTEAGKPEQHLELWREYVCNVIKSICAYHSSQNKTLVFLLWGKKAQQMEEYCENHIVLKWSHPSPLAQGRLNNDQRFENCDHFIALQNAWNVKFNWNPDIEVRIFTDGSATLQKPKNGGHAMYVMEGQYDGMIKYGRTPDIDINGDPCAITNNRGEGLAIINAMEFVKINDIRYPVEIVTDSQLYINIITKWMYEWYNLSPTFTIKKDGGLIANKDIVETLYNLRRANITFRHVNSHRTAPENKDSLEYLLWYGNNVVDQYAKKAYDLEPGETVIGTLSES